MTEFDLCFILAFTCLLICAWVSIIIFFLFGIWTGRGGAATLVFCFSTYSKPLRRKRHQVKERDEWRHMLAGPGSTGSIPVLMRRASDRLAKVCEICYVARSSGQGFQILYCFWVFWTLKQDNSLGARRYSPFNFWQY